MGGLAAYAAETGNSGMEARDKYAPQAPMHCDASMVESDLTIAGNGHR